MKNPQATIERVPVVGLEPEEGVELELSIVGPGGDTKVSISKEKIRVKWGDPTLRERRMIAALIRRARKEQFTVSTVDEDGKPKLPAESKDLPGTLRAGKKEGEVVMVGTVKSVKVLAKDIIRAEVSDGMIVMEAKQDGTWGIIDAEKWSPEAKPGEPKKELQSTRAPGGG